MKELSLVSSRFVRERTSTILYLLSYNLLRDFNAFQGLPKSLRSLELVTGCTSSHTDDQLLVSLFLLKTDISLEIVVFNLWSDFSSTRRILNRVSLNVWKVLRGT